VSDDKRDGTPQDSLPFGEVERLVGLLNESGVGEIRVRNGDVEISVKARSEVPQGTFPSAAPLPRTVGEVVVEAEGAAEAPDEGGPHVVRSPLVGTFYRAAAPGEDPFVEVGDRVVEGQTLCIVEAMKMMNEIPSDVSGEVAEVLVENAKGVEYDQPLFRIRPVA